MTNTETAKYQVFGVAVVCHAAAKAVGEQSQVRAVVRAKSRAAAARHFVAAGLYVNAGQATRHLRVYGCQTGNDIEIATCRVEGAVWVGPTFGPKDRFIAWP